MVNFFKFLSLIILLSIGVESYSQTPVAVNIAVTHIVDSMNILDRAFGDKFSNIDASQSKNYGQLHLYRMQLEAYIDRKLVAVREMKNVEGSENLQNTLIDLLTEERLIEETGLAELENFDKEVPRQVVKDVLANIVEMNKNKDAGMLKFQEAQKEYKQRHKL